MTFLFLSFFSYGLTKRVHLRMSLKAALLSPHTRYGPRDAEMPVGRLVSRRCHRGVRVGHGERDEVVRVVPCDRRRRPQGQGRRRPMGGVAGTPSRTGNTQPKLHPRDRVCPGEQQVTGSVHGQRQPCTCVACQEPAGGRPLPQDPGCVCRVTRCGRLMAQGPHQQVSLGTGGSPTVRGQNFIKAGGGIKTRHTREESGPTVGETRLGERRMRGEQGHGYGPGLGTEDEGWGRRGEGL